MCTYAVECSTLLGVHQAERLVSMPCEQDFVCQVVLEFPEAFWDVEADYFGAALPGGAEGRGRCFMFWNLQRVTGAPVLSALAAGAAAGGAETASDAELGAAALEVLRRVYGADIVPEPRCVLATRWASEEFTRGAPELPFCTAAQGGSCG